MLVTLTSVIIVASTLGFRNYNFNVNVQHVGVSSCGGLGSGSCFRNCVNGVNVKSSKSVRDLSFREDVPSEPIKFVLSSKSVHKSVSTKRVSRSSASTSFVENNVSFSVSRTSACLDQSSPVFNIQNIVVYFSKAVLISEFHLKTG